MENDGEKKINNKKKSFTQFSSNQQQNNPFPLMILFFPLFSISTIVVTTSRHNIQQQYTFSKCVIFRMKMQNIDKLFLYYYYFVKGFHLNYVSSVQTRNVYGFQMKIAFAKLCYYRGRSFCCYTCMQCCELKATKKNGRG